MAMIGSAGNRNDGPRPGGLIRRGPGAPGIRRSEGPSGGGIRTRDSYRPSGETASDLQQREDDEALREMARQRPRGPAVSPSALFSGDDAERFDDLAATDDLTPELGNEALSALASNPEVGGFVKPFVGPNPRPLTAEGFASAGVGVVAGNVFGDLVGDPLGDALGDVFGDRTGALVGNAVAQGFGQSIGQSTFAYLTNAPGASFLQGAYTGVGNGVRNGVRNGFSGAAGGFVGALVGGVIGDAVDERAGALIGGAVGNSVGQSLSGSIQSGATVETAYGSAVSAFGAGLAGGVGALAAQPVGAEVENLLDGIIGDEAAAYASTAAAGGLGFAAGGALYGAGSALLAGNAVGAAALAGAALGPVGVVAAVAPIAIQLGVTAVEKLFDDDQKFTLTEQVLLAGPTFGLSFLANPIKNLFGGGKDKDQQQRDQIRGFLKESGFADQDYRIRLADGSLYNIGDENVVDPRTGEVQRRIYQGDWDNESYPRTVLLAQAVSAAVVGEKEFYTGSFTSMLANAALSNADGDFSKAKENVRQFVADLGLTPESMVARIEKLRQEGAIDDQKAAVYIEGVKSIFLDRPEVDRAPLPPAAFPEFARPTLSGYTLGELTAAGWDRATLARMEAEGRLFLVPEAA